MTSPDGGHRDTDTAALLERAPRLLAAGDAARVADEMAALCSAEPRNARAHFLRGAALHRLSRLVEALAAFEQSLAIEPNDVAARSARAGMLRALGRREESLSAWRELARRAPERPDVHVNLGIALQENGDPQAALDAYGQALALDPGDARALQNRSVLLARVGRSAAAADDARALVRHHPDYLPGQVNLGNLLLAAGEFAEAEVACREALRRAPGQPRAQADLALALAALGRFDEAREAARAAVALAPDVFRTARSEPGDPPFPDPRLVYLVAGFQRLTRADWRDFERQVAVFSEVANDPALAASLQDVMGLMFKSYVLPVPPADRARLAMRVGRGLTERAGRQPRLWVGSRPHDGRRLRVGYLSADYRAHPGALLLLPVLEAHDRDRFEITAYALNADDGSEVRARARNAVERFVDLSALDDEERAWRIHEDGCELLVYREGFTAGTRPEVLAMEPAPLRLSWVGYHGTLGGNLVHYHVTEVLSDPPSEAGLWTERRLYLPHGPFPFPHGGLRVAPVTRREAGLPQAGFVFAALHRGEKIDPALFACWMRLLAAVPDSVLWLLDTAPGLAAALRAHAEAAGIAGGRLVMAPRADLDDHLRRLSAADLWLDTRWYGSHTTLLDCLAAGLPAVTCTGNAVQGRLGHSILAAAGLPELVTHELADYERLALSLAGDPARLQALRRKLLAREAALFDTTAFTRSLETGFELAWARHRQRLPPADIHVPDDVYRRPAASSR